MKCEDCGKDGVMTICPYVMEIFDEEIEVCLCDECYSERCYEI